MRTNCRWLLVMARESTPKAFPNTLDLSSTSLLTCGAGMPGMGHSGLHVPEWIIYQNGGGGMGPTGVRVNAVAPGYIASSGMDNYDASMKPMIRKLRDSFPLKRMGNRSVEVSV